MIIPLLLALACIPVDGPKLLARHAAMVVAEFAQLAPDTELGYAPLPGVVRVMRGDEITRLAAKHGITAPATELCFAWPMKPLDVEQATEAMRKTLPESTRMEVLEVSRAAVPEGVLEFPLDRLQGNIWRGAVRYNGTARFDVWARVRLLARQTRVVTTAPLRTGDIITAGQLRIEDIEDAPVEDLVTTVKEAVGKISKRVLPAGTILKTQHLESAPAVMKGDAVRLHAVVGHAHVSAEVKAQTPGRIGDVIAVKSASSGRLMRARIEAPGEVRLSQ
ncbi:MAG TPA: flagellar basal body P-ring formation chaperone FlgA [Bryobacteraceae bacterium]|nr:flagellar basal body P-ring formation chaperone FlgA [Bryobacteraceae bacterium]